MDSSSAGTPGDAPAGDDFESWYENQFEEEQAAGGVGSPLKLTEAEDGGFSLASNTNGTAAADASGAVVSSSETVYKKYLATGELPAGEVSLQQLIFKQANRVSKLEEEMQSLKSEAAEKAEQLQMVVEMGKMAADKNESLEEEIQRRRDSFSYKVEDSSELTAELQNEVRQLRAQRQKDKVQIAELQEQNLELSEQSEKLQRGEISVSDRDGENSATDASDGLMTPLKNQLNKSKSEITELRRRVREAEEAKESADERLVEMKAEMRANKQLVDGGIKPQLPESPEPGGGRKAMSGGGADTAEVKAGAALEADLQDLKQELERVRELLAEEKLQVKKQADALVSSTEAQEDLKVQLEAAAAAVKELSAVKERMAVEMEEITERKVSAMRKCVMCGH
jgi:chromosome segregation ATPase